MTVHSENRTEQLENEGRVTTEVIGLRYTGPEPSVPPRQPREQGGWPGVTPFQGGSDGEPGPIQIGVCPDWLDDKTVSGGNLGGLEALPNWEVIYDRERLAQALLERNYLPPVIFGGEGRSYEPGLREKVFTKLGLDDVGVCPAAEEDYREQLAEIAGAELSPDDGTEDSGRVATYRQDHSRQVLLGAAEELDLDVDSVRKQDVAEALAGEDAAAVREALEAAEARRRA